MSLDPFQALRASVSEDSVSAARASLANRDWDERDACFVATIEALRDELTGLAPSATLTIEALDFGDSVLSCQMAEGDRATRAAALVWGVAAILPQLRDAQWLEDALKLVERHGQSNDDPPHAELFHALGATLGAHPDTGAPAWRWFAKHAATYATTSPALEAARVTLTLGHRGATKRVVASALAALGGPLERPNP